MPRPSQAMSTRTMRRAQRRYGRMALAQGHSKHAGGRIRRQQSEAQIEALYRGRMKFRALFLNAAILIIPFENHEMKNLLLIAKTHHQHDGVIPVDVEIALTLSGYNVEELTNIWDMLDSAQVDTDQLEVENERAALDRPLNNFE